MTPSTAIRAMSGMPTIVLLPGMDGSGMLFAAFIAALGTDADVVVVRYPPTGGLGYAELEQFARRSLPAHGDFIILGESFSGPIAVALASSAPDGLRGVVLCSSFIRNPQPALGMLHALVRAMPVKLAPAGIANYFLLGRFATPLLQSSVQAALAQVSGTALRARLRAVIRVEASASLRQVQVPLLYLQASHDRLVPPHAAQQIAALHRPTRIVPIDAPHFLLQVAPRQAASAVLEFFQELRKR